MLAINNNIQAINVGRTLTRTTATSLRQIETLSSGLRITRASNDASGLVVSEGMRSQVVRIAQNVRNAENANDLLQVAESSLNEVSSILQSMRVLAVKSSDGHINDDNRQSLVFEFNQLRQSIDRIAQSTTYNTQSLLAGFGRVVGQGATAVEEAADTGVHAARVSGAVAGTYTFEDAGDGSLTLGNGLVTQTLNLRTVLDQGSVADGTRLLVNFDRLGLQMTLNGAGRGAGVYESGDLEGKTVVVQEGTGGIFQVGPTTEEFDRLELDLPDLRASSDTLTLNKVSVSSQSSARQALSPLDLAIDKVAAARGKIGALQNRLGFAVEYSENEVENLQSSESTLRDADVALESSNFARSQILMNSSQAMLAQAFDMSRLALSLL